MRSCSSGDRALLYELNHALLNKGDALYFMDVSKI